MPHSFAVELVEPWIRKIRRKRMSFRWGSLRRNGNKAKQVSQEGGEQAAYRATPVACLARPGAGLVQKKDRRLPIPPSRATEARLRVRSAFPSTGSAVRGAVGASAAVPA